MFNPHQYDDDVVLTTREVSTWTGLSRRSVLAMPALPSLDHLRGRETLFLAGDVKRVFRRTDKAA